MSCLRRPIHWSGQLTSASPISITYTFTAFLLWLKYVCGTSSNSFATEPTSARSRNIQWMFWRAAGFLQNATKLSTMTPSAAMMTLLYSEPEPAVLTSLHCDLDQWGCRNLNGVPPFLLLRFVLVFTNRSFKSATELVIVQSDCKRNNSYTH